MKSKNKQFSELEKHVMHDGGTERAFSGEYWNNTENGKYSCKSCGQILFNSKSKLDSSHGPIGLQGWPAFSNALPGTIIYKDDTSAGMQRIEVRCSQCDVHLGHVFENIEGEDTTHYCINSCSLDFKKED